MCAFIVNPAIRQDADYYRHDEAVVAQILGGIGKLVVGLRRSGKTSFLLRVQREARAGGHVCEYLDLADCEDAEIDALAAAPPDVLLLDEAEVLHDWERARIDRFVKAVRRSRVVAMSCAPQFLLELDREPDSVQRLVEELGHHFLGALSDDEARALLAHAKRPPGPLGDAQVAEALAQGERLAIIVQALGAEAAGQGDVAVSLAGMGKRVLTGLTEGARRILVDAAYGAQVAGGVEAGILIATGALREAGGRIEIASQLLGELIRAATPQIEAAPSPAPAQVAWELHARILHLSDLHFGSHAIDPPKVQARRLTEALERDGRIPDFVAISGDLSWSGHPAELRDAEAFLDLLVEWLRRRRSWGDIECRKRFLVVPGNHEASWVLSSGATPDDGAPSEELEHWIRYSLAPFANFANRFYRQAMFWDLDAPCLATTFDDPSIAFLSLSTAHHITKTARHGKFGRYLRDRAIELLERDDVQKARFRIGVWHHNLRPFHNEGIVIADVEPAVGAFLRAKPALDLALHGHVHQGEVGSVGARLVDRKQQLVYSAVGSFGVVAPHRPGDDRRGRVHNELAVVELHTSRVGRRVRTEFYDLRPDANGDWHWQRGTLSDPWLL